MADAAFGIERGVMDTLRGRTGDEPLLDGPHAYLRRADSALAKVFGRYDNEGGCTDRLRDLTTWSRTIVASAEGTAR